MLALSCIRLRKKVLRAHWGPVILMLTFAMVSTLHHSGARGLKLLCACADHTKLELLHGTILTVLQNAFAQGDSRRASLT